MIKFLRNIALITGLLVSGLSMASDWPRDFKTSFRTGCVEEITRLGMNEPTAWAYCSCFSDSVEDEFGTAGIGKLVMAMNEPENSPTNQRIAELSVPCLNH